MKMEQIATEKLIPYARNSRTHSEAQVAQIAGSIREFGFTNPVLIDGQDGIIAGHGRVMAARALGLAEVPCIRLGHLTDAQKRAYVIADNKLALNAGWDDEMLLLEIGELQDDGFDVGLLGFEDAEIDALMGAADFAPDSENEQGKLDELSPQWVSCPNCGKEFDAREPR
jgi:ParB-like chromosome segregation protein Spo0J